MDPADPDDAPDWVLGLDGGGTSARLALASRLGQVLGPFHGPGGSPLDQAGWLELLLELLGRSPVVPAALAHASLGLPSFGELEAVDQAQLEAARAWAGHERLTVMNDVQAAWTGAFGFEAGALVLAGTGSMAWAGDGAGRHVRVGGWGEAFGDEGSAHWVGRAALGRLSWTLDGRLDDPAFRDGLLAATGARDAQGLLSWFHGLAHPRSGVASLAARVDDLAEDGNHTARLLLLEAAHLLVGQLQAAWRALGLAGPVRFSHAGSVFSSRTVLDAVRQAVAATGELFPPRLPPLGGALLDAARRAGWAATPAWRARVAEGLSRARPEGGTAPADNNLEGDAVERKHRA